MVPLRGFSSAMVVLFQLNEHLLKILRGELQTSSALLSSPAAGSCRPMSVCSSSPPLPDAFATSQRKNECASRAGWMRCSPKPGDSEKHTFLPQSNSLSQTGSPEALSWGLFVEKTGRRIKAGKGQGLEEVLVCPRPRFCSEGSLRAVW